MNNRTKLIAAAVAGATALSAGGLGFIAGKEGKVNTPYRDIAGVWTVCYGSTGAHVIPDGVARTDEQCLTLLREDAQRFEATVNRCTPAPKNQNQFDAMVSLSFNIGPTAYCNSTFARKFNECGSCAEDQFVRWNKARVNGVLVPVRGLTNRRLAERALFLTPVVEAPPIDAHGEQYIPETEEAPECR